MKALMKAFWDFLEVGSDENEEESYASSEATVAVNPQRELFGNLGFDTREYFPKIEDL